MILGQFAGGPAVRTDYNQTDPGKADYLVGRENIAPKTHVKDKNNPHGVTAEQAGARPNTWLPAIAEIGAAPSGYGLGTGSTSKAVKSITANGWYVTNQDTPNSVWLLCHAFVTNSGADITVEAWGLNGETKYKITKKSGIWGEWEYINPPMYAGIEYRTTERWNGKPVYRKLIQYTNEATISGDSETLIPHGISNLDLSIGVRTSGRRRDMPLPFIKSNGSTSIGYLTSTDLCLKVTGSTTWSSNLWTFELWYTKTS